MNDISRSSQDFFTSGADSAKLGQIRRRTLFISLNPFGMLPLMRYIIPQFAPQTTAIVTTHVSGGYSFKINGKVYYLMTFENSVKLNEQTKGQWIMKYARIFIKLLRFGLFDKTEIIYTIDFQILPFIILIRKYFGKKIKIIYHQFEIVDPAICTASGKLLLRYVLKNADLINLLIFPEINRGRYFNGLSNGKAGQSIIIPNTNNLHSQNIEPGQNINKTKTVIAHIGTVGPAHYIWNYLEFIRQSHDSDLEFLFIGRIDKEVEPFLQSMADIDERIQIIKELPHEKLLEYYNAVDIGVVLYKGVDRNNEFCAPNKLYEYWAYGIPVIAHKLKGLEGIWNNPLQGTLIDFQDIFQVQEAINELKKRSENEKQSLKDYFQKRLSLSIHLDKLSKKVISL